MLWPGATAGQRRVPAIRGAGSLGEGCFCYGPSDRERTDDTPGWHALVPADPPDLTALLLSVTLITQDSEWENLLDGGNVDCVFAELGGMRL